MSHHNDAAIILSKARKKEKDSEAKFLAKLVEFEYLSGYNDGLEFIESHLIKNNIEFITETFSENVTRYLKLRNEAEQSHYMQGEASKSKHFLRGEIKGMIDADKLLTGSLKLDKLMYKVKMESGIST